MNVLPESGPAVILNVTLRPTTGLPPLSWSVPVTLACWPTLWVWLVGESVAPSPTMAVVPVKLKAARKMLSLLEGLAVATVIFWSPLWTNGTRLYSSSSLRLPSGPGRALGFAGLASLSPMPPTVISAPSAAEPSSNPPAELVSRFPLTSTVLYWLPKGGVSYENEIPSDMSRRTLGSLVLIGLAVWIENVSPVVFWAPNNRTTVLLAVWVGSLKMTASASPSTLDVFFSVTASLVMPAGAASSVDLTSDVTSPK